MLTLVLTRPRLRWLEQLTEGSTSHRLWAERALTIFSFVMGGYAWMSLFLVLHKQLGAEVSAMLKGAAAFIVLYAGLVHFEPFLAEWRSGKGGGAALLYVCIAGAAVLLGAEIAILVLEPSFTHTDLEMTVLVIVFACLGPVLYRTV